MTTAPTELNTQTQTIADAVVGSHAYGLANKHSDIDNTIIYVDKDPKKIFGIDVNINSGSYKTSSEEGIVKTEHTYYELRKYLTLLRKCSTHAIELLWISPADYVYLSFLFNDLIDNRVNLIDPEKLKQSVLGYSASERRLALGERTGLLGSDRKNALDKYGFSPKNVANLIRICGCTERFLAYGFYPVNLVDHDYDFGNHAKLIKNDPEQYGKDEIEKIMNYYIERLKKTEPVVSSKWDQNFVDDYVNKVYKGVLNGNV